jgi:hypothetical protein
MGKMVAYAAISIAARHDGDSVDKNMCTNSQSMVVHYCNVMFGTESDIFANTLVGLAALCRVKPWKCEKTIYQTCMSRSQQNRESIV